MFWLWSESFSLNITPHCVKSVFCNSLPHKHQTVNHVITDYFQLMSVHYSKLFSKQCHWSPDTLVISVPVRAISLNLLSKLTAHLLHPFVISALCHTSTPLTNASNLCIFAITSCLRRYVAHYQDFDPLITTHRALSSWQTCSTGCQYMHARTLWNAVGNRPSLRRLELRLPLIPKLEDKMSKHPWCRSDFIDQYFSWCNVT